MIEFVNGENLITLDNNYSYVHLNLSAKVQEKTSSYLVYLPAFHIHFYTKNKQDIEKSAHESLVSFFNFWIHQKNVDHFHQHLSALGFTYQNKEVYHVAEPTVPYGNTTQVMIDRLILS